MPLLISIPILAGLAIVQSVMLSNIHLLLGTVDIILVVLLAWALQDRVQSAWQWSLIGGGFMTLLSGLPIGVYIAGYLGATFIARYIRRRIWKLPFLGMLTATFSGSLLVIAASWLARWLTGVYIPIGDALILITLPSVLLNLLITVPVFFVMKDLATRLYPKEIEV
jgi:rod shape-determining protein MreD